MHERGVIGLVVHELLADAGGRPVGTVTVEVGPDVSMEAACAAWESAAEGTVAATAAVSWVTRPHGLRCFECGLGYRGDRLDSCPGCGGNGLVVEAAPEARLAQWMPGAP